jgi:hypothetical protein
MVLHDRKWGTNEDLLLVLLGSAAGPRVCGAGHGGGKARSSGAAGRRVAIGAWLLPWQAFVALNLTTITGCASFNNIMAVTNFLSGLGMLL